MFRIYALVILCLSVCMSCSDDGDQAPASAFAGEFQGEYMIDELRTVPLLDENMNYIGDSTYVFRDTIACTVTITELPESLLQASGCNLDFEFTEEEGVLSYDLFGRFAWPPVSTDHFRVSIDEAGNLLLVEDRRADPSGYRYHVFAGYR